MDWNASPGKKFSFAKKQQQQRQQEQQRQQQRQQRQQQQQQGWQKPNCHVDAALQKTVVKREPPIWIGVLLRKAWH